jgi:hypothetical protein
MLKRPFLSAIALTLCTFMIRLVVDHLPYSKARDLISDTITLPGAVMAGLLYPERYITGHSDPTLGLLSMVSNWVVYILFWYACLRIIRHFRRAD